jgi:hypothetical protein
LPTLLECRCILGEISNPKLDIKYVLFGVQCPENTNRLVLCVHPLLLGGLAVENLLSPVIWITLLLQIKNKGNVMGTGRKVAADWSPTHGHGHSNIKATRVQKEKWSAFFWN